MGKIVGITFPKEVPEEISETALTTDCESASPAEKEPPETPAEEEKPTARSGKKKQEEKAGE